MTSLEEHLTQVAVRLDEARHELAAADMTGTADLDTRLMLALTSGMLTDLLAVLQEDAERRRERRR